MTGKPQIVLTLLSDTTPEQARAARARAWAYVFDCFNHRRNEKEGGPETAPDDAKEIKHVRAGFIVPK